MTNSRLAYAAASLLIAAPAALAQTDDAPDDDLTPQLGPVVISEIMYNPGSREGGYRDDEGNVVPTMTEWVELYNPTDEPVDMAGWTLSDEDGATSPFPAGTTLEPDSALVVIPAQCTAEVFAASWGDAQTVGVNGWSWDGMRNLANSPSANNEILRLNNADGHVVDEVNFDDDPPWPGDSPHGPSIYVKPGFLTPIKNDDPGAWARSTAGTHAARQGHVTDAFDGDDFGSPGTVIAE